MPRRYAVKFTRRICFGVIPLNGGVEHPLAGVDHTIHGGDVGHPNIIAALSRIAPGTAPKGNVDTADWARGCADTECARLVDRSVFVRLPITLATLDITPDELRPVIKRPR
jgi:hypothetical protein